MASYDTSTAWAWNGSFSSVNFTVASNSNRLLVVTVALYFGQTQQAVSSMTFNGVAMTAAKQGLGAGQGGAEVWYLLNPSTGTHALVVNLTSGCDIAVTAYSFYNVLQTAPEIAHELDNTGSGTISDALTLGTANEVVVSIISTNSSTIPSTTTLTRVAGSTDGGAGQSQGSGYKIPSSSGSFTASWAIGSGSIEYDMITVCFKDGSSTAWTKSLLDVTNSAELHSDKGNKISMNLNVLTDLKVARGGKRALDLLVQSDLQSGSRGKVGSALDVTTAVDIHFTLTGKGLVDTGMLSEARQASTSKVTVEGFMVTDRRSALCGVNVVDALAAIETRIVTIVAPLIENGNLAELISKQIGRTASDTLSVADFYQSYAVKVILDFLGVSDSDQALTDHLVTEASSLVSALARQIGRLAIEAIMPSDQDRVSTTVPLTDQSSLADFASFVTAHVASELLAVVDQLTAIGGITVSPFTELIALADMDAAATLKWLADVIGETDALSNRANKNAAESIVLLDLASDTLARSMIDVLPDQDFKTPGVFGRRIADALGIQESRKASAGKVALETTQVTERRIAEAFKVLVDLIQPPEVFTTQHGRTVVEAAQVTDQALTLATRIRSLTDVFGVADTRRILMNRVVTDALQIAENRVASAGKLAIEIMTVADREYGYGAHHVALQDVVRISELPIPLHRTLKVADAVRILDQVFSVHGVAHTCNEVLIIRDSRSSVTQKNLREAVGMLDGRFAGSEKTVVDPDQLAEVKQSGISHKPTDSIPLAEYESRSATKNLNDHVEASDQSRKADSKSLIDHLEHTEHKSDVPGHVARDNWWVSDERSAGIGKSLRDVAELVDITTHSQRRTVVLSDILKVAESLRKGEGKLVVESIPVTDEVTWKFGRHLTIGDTLVIIDAYGEVVLLLLRNQLDGGLYYLGGGLIQ